MTEKMAAMRTALSDLRLELPSDVYADVALKVEAVVTEFQEALVWCSGSGDFAPEGKAHGGWTTVCAPLMPGGTAGPGWHAAVMSDIEKGGGG